MSDMSRLQAFLCMTESTIYWKQKQNKSDRWFFLFRLVLNDLVDGWCNADLQHSLWETYSDTSNLCSLRYGNEYCFDISKALGWFCENYFPVPFKGLHLHRQWVLGSDVSRSTATSFVRGFQQHKQRRTALTTWRTTMMEDAVIGAVFLLCLAVFTIIIL